LSGVTVTLKNTQTVTTTDDQGFYSISVPQENATLIYTIVGFSPEERIVSSNTTIDVVLEEFISDLEDVVVVGYGTQKKINLTGAVDVVSGEQLANRPSPNISMLLQGVSPNTNISLNS